MLVPLGSLGLDPLPAGDFPKALSLGSYPTRNRPQNADELCFILHLFKQILSITGFNTGTSYFDRPNGGFQVVMVAPVIHFSLGFAMKTNQRASKVTLSDLKSISFLGAGAFSTVRLVEHRTWWIAGGLLGVEMRKLKEQTDLLGRFSKHTVRSLFFWTNDEFGIV
jgi:hypothetical protein